MNVYGSIPEVKKTQTESGEDASLLLSREEETLAVAGTKFKRSKSTTFAAVALVFVLGAAVGYSSSSNSSASNLRSILEPSAFTLGMAGYKAYPVGTGPTRCPSGMDVPVSECKAVVAKFARNPVKPAMLQTNDPLPGPCGCSFDNGYSEAIAIYKNVNCMATFSSLICKTSVSPPPPPPPAPAPAAYTFYRVGTGPVRCPAGMDVPASECQAAAAKFAKKPLKPVMMQTSMPVQGPCGCSVNDGYSESLAIYKNVNCGTTFSGLICKSAPPPTPRPTVAPTASPTAPPTSPPTASPTAPPTKAPTASPTAPPTKAPTASPTAPPTSPPTVPPTDPPTAAPTPGTPKLYNKGEGPGVCPPGSEVSEENCFATAYALGKAAGHPNLNNYLNVGTWRNLPCGCFIYDEGPRQWIDYKDPSAGTCAANGVSQLICA